MLNTQEFGRQLEQRGFNFFSGVPCSFLKSLINYAISEVNYLGAANEGDALAACAGAYLGGKKPVVMLQNSGLGNAVSPLTSLTHTYKIPVLGFVTLRGEPGISDEPQHELMGVITEKLLETMGIPWAYLPQDQADISSALETAESYLAQGQTFFFVVKKGTFDSYKLTDQKQVARVIPQITATTPTRSDKPSREQILEIISQAKDADTYLLATTGFSGRELYEVADCAQHFYQVGSMGCVSAIGLGLALSQPSKKVIVIDGDGACLMRMGNMATLGHYKAPNLLHVLLDNAHHESTGAQETVSSSVDFAAIAASCNYTQVISAAGTADFKAHLMQWIQDPQNSFLYQATRLGIKENLGRPKITPLEQQQRLRSAIAAN
jgi:phosphonopyruvate decarboxylase